MSYLNPFDFRFVFHRGEKVTLIWSDIATKRSLRDSSSKTNNNNLKNVLLLFANSHVVPNPYDFYPLKFFVFHRRNSQTELKGHNDYDLLLYKNDEINPSRVDFNNSAFLSKFPRPRRWAGDRWLMFGEWAVFKPAVCVAGQAGIVACANPWGLVRSVQTAARLISSLAPERLSP